MRVFGVIAPGPRSSTTKVPWRANVRTVKIHVGSALLRASLRANGWPARCNSAVNSKSKTKQPEGGKNHETRTTFIQYDQRHISVGVDGRLRHNKQHAEQREYAGGIR